MNKFFGIFVEPTDETPVPASTPTPSVEVAPIGDVSSVKSISDIYLENGLENQDASIYKILELKDGLPTDMALATKKQSVLSVLPIMKLDLNSILADGEKRIETLEATLESFTLKTVELIKANNDSIAALEEQINAAKKDNNDLVVTQEHFKESIDSEVLKINTVINFIK